MQRYNLAIDVGASSGRHILGWIEDGELKTEEIYRFTNAPIQANGHLKWDIERLFSEMLNGLKKASELKKIPETVGIDTWGVDYVLLDEKDEVLDGAYCYRDNRTEESIESVHKLVSFAELYEKTGIAFNAFNSVYQLFCDKKSGRMAKAKSFLMLPDYFHFRLTGEKRQEYTNATTTGLVNAKTHCWDEEILSALGLKKELFGKLSEPSDPVGEFSEEISKIVGYKTKVILPATHDTASAVLAAPLDGQTPYISSGTWSLLGIEQPQAHTDESSRKTGYSNEGSVGGQFRFQKNIMGLWMIQQVRRELDDKYTFAELADLAKDSPIEAEIDVNAERFLAPKSMIKEIEVAVGRELTVGETSYCILNNLAKDYARSLSALEQTTGERYQTLNIIGGGSKNGLLNELTKKYTDKRIITGPTECTAIGNLIMQMVGAGTLLSVQEGRKIIKKSFEIKEI